MNVNVHYSALIRSNAQNEIAGTCPAYVFYLGNFGGTQVNYVRLIILTLARLR